MEGDANNTLGRKAQSPYFCALELSECCFPLEGALTMGTDSPKSDVAVFWSTGLLTTQVRLALGWFRGRLTGGLRELAAGPNVLHTSSLGRPLLSQVTFRSSLFSEALHSRVTSHQFGVTDDDLNRIWGRVMGSGTNEIKESSLTRVANIPVLAFLSIISLKLWHPPSKEGGVIFRGKNPHNLPKLNI